MPTGDGKQRMLVQPLDIRAVTALCEALDASREDLEKVLIAERVIYPKLNG